MNVSRTTDRNIHRNACIPSCVVKRTTITQLRVYIYVFFMCVCCTCTLYSSTQERCTRYVQQTSYTRIVTTCYITVASLLLYVAVWCMYCYTPPGYVYYRVGVLLYADHARVWWIIRTTLNHIRCTRVYYNGIRPYACAWHPGGKPSIHYCYLRLTLTPRG